MKATRLLVCALAVAALALIATLGLSARAAGGTTVVVTEDDIARQPENTPPTRNWVLYTRNAGNGTFRVGPGAPPSGVGSFETVTPTGADKATLFNYDHVGTALDSITALGYSTYRTSGASPNQVPAINLEVDVNGAAAGGFTTLVFEPVYNTAQGVVADGEWQTWDAKNGFWWSTKNIPGVCAFDCFVKWDDIVAANPGAVIAGGFGVNQGSGNPALTAASDALNIAYGGSSVTYDFEPYRVAATKDDCKVGRWQSVKRADGSPFKNQGQCVSYVEARK
ncbi:MAG TPA: hypothetical protein VM936_03360 [Pyrinomonadaceae bacterium]|nr:hypothetical protein [Pyrinomonadaceae bacterium]